MITEESKEFLGEKVKLDDKLGIIVGLTEIPNYSPYIYDEDRTLINSRIDKNTMFIVSLESGETVIVGLVTTTEQDNNWGGKLSKNKILEDLRTYQKREINKIKSVGKVLRGKFVKYPEYNRFNKNLDNLKLEVVLWEKL